MSKTKTSFIIQQHNNPEITTWIFSRCIFKEKCKSNHLLNNYKLFENKYNNIHILQNLNYLFSEFISWLWEGNAVLELFILTIAITKGEN